MINQEQLLSKYDDKKANYYLVDVRSPAEFADHHIPGSVNIPIEDLEMHLKEIPKDRPIITICQYGATRSPQAETFLREKGYQADCLQGGLLRWTGQMEHSN